MTEQPDQDVPPRDICPNCFSELSSEDPVCPTCGFDTLAGQGIPPSGVEQAESEG